MLAGKGFKTIYNLSGGIKAWDSNTAVGPQDQGMELFTGEETVQEALIVAYSMEAGLEDFYQTLAPKGLKPAVTTLFKALARIETKHQDRLYGIYHSLSDNPLSRPEFEAQTQSGILEGGMSTEAYLDQFQPDLGSTVEVVSLAMSIEAQALDLYQRAARNCSDSAGEKAFQQIANEEKTHLKQLGQLLEGQLA
jgi:rubrerythrin